MRIFFFNDTATTEIYTLSLHDALPICRESRLLPDDARQRQRLHPDARFLQAQPPRPEHQRPDRLFHLPDRKSTRLNSSHSQISYAVFCLKKKTITYEIVLETRHLIHDD